MHSADDDTSNVNGVAGGARRVGGASSDGAAERASDSDLAAQIQDVLDTELQRHRSHLISIDTDLAVLVDDLAGLAAGGKRLRPTLCYWGWRGAGAPHDEQILRAATALELLHLAALIHDDVMDRADTRRGRQASHRRFAADHSAAGWRGSAQQFGDSAAILLGDLCLGWSDELLARSGIESDRLAAGRRVFEQMRTEVMCGQFLDVLAQAKGLDAVDDEAAMLRQTKLVIHFKSAKYSVEAPLLMGGALAGGSDGLATTYSAFGMAVGEAFQLRDDVLGVFGDPAKTGKPAGDDLREGKQTMLVGYALHLGSTTQQRTLRSLVGNPRIDEADVDTAREILIESGALARVEQRIGDLHDQAIAHLRGSEVQDPATDHLRRLASIATSRNV